VKINYDIRGKYPEEINEKFVAEIINNLSNGKVILAYDSRESSKKIADYVLNNSSKEILLLGNSTTPLASFASFLYKTIAVMITASHLGNEYNGIKISENGFAWEKEKYLDLLEKIKYSKLKKREDFSKVKVIDIRKDVIKNYEERWLKVHESIPKVLNEENNPGKKLIKELNLKEEEKELKFKFDSDCDRLYVFYNDNELHRDLVGIILAKYLSNKKDTVIFNVGCSVLVYEELKDRNLEMVKTGRNFMIEAMKGAKFGFEYSGHYYFYDEELDYYLDDGLKALVEINKIGITKFLQEYKDLEKKTNLSQEYRVPGKLSDFRELINKLKNKSFRIIDIDGYRFEFGNRNDLEGFFLIRQSNTEEKVSIRFEHKNKEEFEKLKNLVENYLKNYESL
jgi:phosphomannomutase